MYGPPGFQAGRPRYPLELPFDPTYEMASLGALTPFRDRLPSAFCPDTYRPSLPFPGYEEMAYAPRPRTMRRGRFRRPSYARFLEDEDEDDWDGVDCDDSLALLLRKMSGMIRGRGQQRGLKHQAMLTVCRRL